MGDRRSRSRRGRGARPLLRGRGQHFLVPRLAADLVRNTGVTRGDLVVEIGAGTGVLTNELAARVRAVIAIEVDSDLVRRLRARFSGVSNVRVVSCDALRFGMPEESFRVVANVPFTRTTAILRKLLDDPTSALMRADLIVQWGAAVKRCSQRPSTMLSIAWAPWFELTITRKLAPESFRPPPACDAAVMTITRRPDPLLPTDERDAFEAFLEREFPRRADATSLDAWEWTERFRRLASARAPRGTGRYGRLRSS